MRLDEFVRTRGVAVSPVDGFDGFEVQVGLPLGWEPFDSATGVQVWTCRNDPRIDDFCANAVLTMHHVAVSLDPSNVFAMLVDQQLHSLPGSRERHRDLAEATDGAGVRGLLALEITHDVNILDSVSRTRILTTNGATLIAQLTVSALRDSPLAGEAIWLIVRDAAAGSTSPAQRPETPATETRQARR
jgi:hypothetical protein